MIYLDWNILDRLEKIETFKNNEYKLYQNLLDHLDNDKVIVPYSNAHLNDLIRGYKKNPNFINGHLDILSKISNDLCICQYWENSKVTIHYRKAHSFFESALREKEYEADNFEELMTSFQEVKELWELQLSLLKKQPVDKIFLKIYKADPIFNLIYPRTKNELNVLALSSDLYNFSLMVHKDFAIYRSLRKFINQTIIKYKNDSTITNLLKKSFVDKPLHLEIDSILDKFSAEQKHKSNPNYHKIMDTFFRFDLKGYRADSKFSNMIDDSLHTFYASFCNYFISNDNRCRDKAIATYKRLNISTKVLSAEEYIKEINV